MTEPYDGPKDVRFETELQLLREKVERLEGLRGVNGQGRQTRRALAGLFLATIFAVLLLAIMGAQSKSGAQSVSDALFIDANGNVGINGTSPRARLDVNGNAVVRGQLDVTGNNGAIKFPDGTAQTTAAVLTGAVIAFNSEACPAGWTEYKPAYGRFIRGIDKGGDKNKGDPDGQRHPGDSQNDAIRNITGSISGVNGATNQAWQWGFMPGTSGAFDVQKKIELYNKFGGQYSPPGGVGNTADFNASRVVPTAEENRPKNVALLYCKKENN